MRHLVSQIQETIGNHDPQPNLTTESHVMLSEEEEEEDEDSDPQKPQEEEVDIIG